MTETKNNTDRPVGQFKEDVYRLHTSFSTNGLLRTGSELILSFLIDHIHTIADSLESHDHWVPDEAGTSIVDGKPYIVFRWTDLRSNLDTWMWSKFDNKGLFAVLRDIPLEDFYMRLTVPLSVVDTDNVWVREVGEGPSDIPEVMIPQETDRPKERKEQEALLTCTVSVEIPRCGPYWNDVLHELEHFGVDTDHSVPGIGVYALTDVDYGEDEDGYPLTIYQIQTIIPFESVPDLNHKRFLCTHALKRRILWSRYRVNDIHFSMELLSDPPQEVIE